MRLDAIGIVCADLEASIAFYRSLGVDLPEYDPEEGHVEADLGGGIRLMLDSHAVVASFVEGFTPPTANDRVTFAVRFDSPAAVDESYARLVDDGATGEREPFDAFWGQRYATVADPDGNLVDLYAALPDA